MTPESLSAQYFENLYAHSEDPWGFESRWYEQRKYALTMAALPRARYRRALEPGCSIGVLTEMLAHRCDEVIATDVVDTALARTRERMNRSAATSTVRCRRWAFGQGWRVEVFDLIVLSEVGYYLSADALGEALRECVEHLEPQGTLMCVHWQRSVPEYPLTGAQVHDIARSTSGLAHLGSYTDADLQIDIFTATTAAAPSVAEHDGLVP